MATRKTTGRIERLGLQEIIDPMLAASKTYDEIIAEVEQRKGIRLNDSNLSRYRARWSSVQARLDAAKQEAETIMAVLQSRPDGNLLDAAMGLMTGKLMERFAQAQDGFDEADLPELGHLLVRIARTGQLTEALAIQRDRLELSKQRVAMAEKVKGAMTSAGVAPEQVTEMVNEILGVTA